MFTRTFRGSLLGAERPFARGGVPAGVLLPKLARYQLRHTSILCLVVFERNCPLLYLQTRALPVVTKARTAFVTSLVLAKSLPLLMPRFIRHRRRFGNVPNCATPRLDI